MQSVRLLMRREGQRDVLLVTRNYCRLAQLVRPAFDRCNLTMSPQALERLLEEGVNLVGAGLLDLIKHDGAADAGRVLGLAGMLLAARDYRLRHPQSLIVSVDQEIARLWLRLGNRPERCDLLCLRMGNDRFLVEPLEVKATFSGAVSAIRASSLMRNISLQPPWRQCRRACRPMRLAVCCQPRAVRC